VDVGERLGIVLACIRAELAARPQFASGHARRETIRAGPGPGFCRERRFRRNRPAARAP
jgi:hypothetical protein